MAVVNLHWPAGSRVCSIEVTACPVGVLENGTEVSHTDNDMELVGHLDLGELVHLHGDRGVEWLLQYS